MRRAEVGKGSAKSQAHFVHPGALVSACCGKGVAAKSQKQSDWGRCFVNFQPQQGKLNPENWDHGPGVGQAIRLAIGGFGGWNEIDDEGERHRQTGGIVNANDADPPRLQQSGNTRGCRGVKLALAPGDYGLIVADQTGLLRQEGGWRECDAAKRQI